MFLAACRTRDTGRNLCWSSTNGAEVLRCTAHDLDLLGTGKSCLSEDTNEDMHDEKKLYPLREFTPFWNPAPCSAGHPELVPSEGTSTSRRLSCATKEVAQLQCWHLAIDAMLCDDFYALLRFARDITCAL